MYVDGRKHDIHVDMRRLAMTAEHSWLRGMKVRIVLDSARSVRLRSRLCRDGLSLQAGRHNVTVVARMRSAHSARAEVSFFVRAQVDAALGLYLGCAANFTPHHISCSSLASLCEAQKESPTKRALRSAVRR